jgi:hypothetical protein
MISRCNPVLACEMSLRPNDRHVTLRADGSQRFRQKKWQIHPQKMCALHGTRDDHGALFGCFCGRVRDEDDAAAEVNEAFHLMHEGKTLRSVITFPHAGVAEVAAHRAEHLRGAIAFLRPRRQAAELGGVRPVAGGQGQRQGDQDRVAPLPPPWPSPSTKASA